MNANGATKVAYPVTEGFDLIGLTRTAGYAAIASGELKTYKAGRRRFVTHKALVDYTERKQRESAKAA
jgi:hypothetical protein